MKRSFLLLLIALAALYAKVGYDLRTADASLVSAPRGVLSDIAEKVTAIPLQSADGYPVEKPKSIRRDGNNLFLISGNILYRYDISGRFICRVTHPALIRVAEYVIDPLRKQLIVLGNTDDIHYYTFEGRLTAKRKPETSLPHRRMQAVVMYRDCIWTAEERLRFDSLTQEWYVEQHLVKYDTSFHEIEANRFVAADLPGKPVIPFSGNMDIAVAEYSGLVYACAPSLQPDDLLRDSFWLKSGHIFPGRFPGDGRPYVYPLRFGPRFWLASYSHPADASQRYTFCFDSTTHRSWQLNDGFEDDFHHTGFIPEWQAMDIYSRTYCFSRLGKEVNSTSFPGVQAVVFIVELKA
ncbi:MAG: 6-bladed beta-propeller [Tannerellaceae bacterium]|nr:6-bladed beta-propeller [Tannerellaceae bacterium]